MRKNLGEYLNKRLFGLFVLFSSIILFCGTVKGNPVAVGPPYSGHEEFLADPLRGLLVLLYINLPVNTGLYLFFVIEANQRNVSYFSMKKNDRLNRVIVSVLLISLSGIFIDYMWLLGDTILSYLSGLLFIFISVFLINRHVQQLRSKQNVPISFFFVLINLIGWGFIEINFPDVNMGYTVISIFVVSWMIGYFSMWYSKRKAHFERNGLMNFGGDLEY